MHGVPTSVLGLLLTVSAAHGATDLEAVWHFDEPKGSRVLDASGKGRDGRLRGATRVPGRFASAVRCDGKAGYVSLPGVQGLPQGTVEAWIKLLQPAGRGQTGFVTFGLGYGNKNDVAILGCSPLMPKFSVTPSSFGICSQKWRTAQDPAGLPVGEWVHLAGTWGPGGLEFYRSGKLAAADPGYVGALPGHPTVLIGASSWNRHMACVVDEVRIYSRCLTAAELARHAASADYVAAPAQPVQRLHKLPGNAHANVADFYSATDPTCGIQKAIDSLPPQGGVVALPPGTYRLRQGVHLRSHVTLQGAGPSSVLTREEQVRSLLSETAQAGQHTLTVASAEGFEVGMEVAVKSRKQAGWYTTHAIVTAVEGSVLRLDRPLKRTYPVEGKAVAINYFPAITAVRLRNVVVQDLCFDGSIEDNPGPDQDFTLAAIHFFATSGSAIRRCVVRGWPSDAIGVQSGSNVQVTDCVASGCRGHGFHPGTGLRHAVFNGNLAHHNTGDGLYFCMAVQFIVVSNSVFHHNRGDGIGGLGGGGDRYNVVTGNVCEANGQHGIDASGGSENSIASNICLNNSQGQPGRYVGICLRDTTHATVTGNRCLDDQKRPTQTQGIHESGKSDYNLFAANHLVGHSGKALVVVGPNSRSEGNLVGPRAGEPNGE